jgi:hypothetical protein
MEMIMIKVNPGESKLNLFFAVQEMQIRLIPIAVISTAFCNPHPEILAMIKREREIKFYGLASWSELQIRVV